MSAVRGRLSRGLLGPTTDFPVALSASGPCATTGIIVKQERAVTSSKDGGKSGKGDKRSSATGRKISKPSKTLSNKKSSKTGTRDVFEKGGKAETNSGPPGRRKR